MMAAAVPSAFSADTRRFVINCKSLCYCAITVVSRCSSREGCVWPRESSPCTLFMIVHSSMAGAYTRYVPRHPPSTLSQGSFVSLRGRTGGGGPYQDCLLD